MKFWEQLKVFWNRFWKKSGRLPIMVLPAPSTEPREQKIIQIEEEKAWSKFDYSFRKTVLDDLDIQFEVLKHFKRTDPDSYNLYSQVGCYLLPESVEVGGEISPWFLEHRPSFGAVAPINVKLHEEYDKKENKLLPRFVYFEKYKPHKAPAHIQKTNRGDIYLVTLYYEDFKRKKIRFPIEVPIALASDGSVFVLKQHLHNLASIKIKHSKRRDLEGGRVKSFTIPTNKWEIPKYWKEFAEDHKIDPIEHAVILFTMAANFYEAATMGGITRVDVRKDDLHLALSVDPKRTAYFFRDREKTSLPGNTSKRIFHAVKPHRRIVKGEERYVKYHFRGERDFDWNGYRVQISVPYLDHLQMAEFNVSAIDDPELTEGSEDWVGMKELGKRMREIATADYKKAPPLRAGSVAREDKSR